MDQAFLKKEVGEEAVVQTPNGNTAWKIRKVEYEK
ncbi:GreA/GreB family elongation factor [Algoriphagus aestuariicola]|uniref:GreA/GreB family elongation factor n=1 Tax=Algoriphagus aestuariicola TaxID=1852016 RepID=A0ABS3BVK5_9BACT|nr:GreA/GreB family elongation factor [Algoriphagus aestuariicola]